MLQNLNSIHHTGKNESNTDDPNNEIVRLSQFDIARSRGCSGGFVSTINYSYPLGFDDRDYTNHHLCRYDDTKHQSSKHILKSPITLSISEIFLDHFSTCLATSITAIPPKTMPMIVGSSCSDAHFHPNTCVPIIATTAIMNPSAAPSDDLIWYMVLVCCH